MRNLLFSYGVGLLLLTASPFVTEVAHAQVSDGDRAAARELFFDGVKLQQDGKFPDALDRFTRAQRVFSAPTHLLHIAECQVATGQLVEGAETYRTLVRTALPQGSPAAFTQARDQGAAELAQVEPRIPSVKIDVTPQNVANLQVQIDGAAMNTALVGVSRPINPGTHKIAVFAPGYAKQEATVAVKEREAKSVPISLQAQGGVVYAPAPVPPPVTTGEPPPANPPPPTPPGQDATWQTEQKPSQMGLMLGVRLGVMFPTGTLLKQNTVSSTSVGTSDVAMSDVATTGGAGAIEGGLRFARRFYIGIGFEHGFYGKGDKVGDFNGTAGAAGTSSTTVASNLVDLRVALITNPEGVGFYGELGLGYRWLSLSNDFTSGALSASTTQVASGGEFEAGAGIHIRAGKSLRIIPKVSFGLGAFNKLSQTCTASGGAVCNGGDTTTDIQNTGFHTFVFLGLGGYFNIDFDKK